MKRPTINDYPQTDARTFKNLDGSVDWKKYAEALEEYADSLQKTYPLEFVEWLSDVNIEENYEYWNDHVKM